MFWFFFLYIYICYLLGTYGIEYRSTTNIQLYIYFAMEIARRNQFFKNKTNIS